MKVILAVMQLKLLQRKPRKMHVHTYDLYYIHISDSHGDILNSLLTYYQQGFIAQLYAPVLWRSWVRIPLKPQNFFWAFFSTALVAVMRITFTSSVIKPCQLTPPHFQVPPLSFHRIHPTLSGRPFEVKDS